MKSCQRCLLTSQYRQIQFDRWGICNYCRTYDGLEENLMAFDSHAKLLEERLNLLRGKYEYDCLVGISGGKDSSYVAYRLKKRYGLRILTFTFDNGFLTEEAKQNIQHLVKKLEVDHFFHKPDWTFYRECYRQSIWHFGYPCPVCAYSSYAFMNKVAFEKRIPLCVHGRSPSQMFKELLEESLDPFLPFVRNNLSPYDVRSNRETAREVFRRSESMMKRFLPDRRLREKFRSEFFPDRNTYERRALLPEFLGLFLYETYDEGDIKATLARELGGSPPSDPRVLSHSDCRIHDAAMFLYHQVFGYSLLSLELSVMVRQGHLEKEEALTRLALEKCLNAAPEESLEVLFSACGLKAGDINHIISRARKRHTLRRLAWGLRRRFRG